MQETDSFYSVTYSQIKGSEHCYIQSCSYNLFSTKNLQLAREVFIFRLLGRSPYENMTPFEQQKCKQSIQNWRSSKMARCDCRDCLEILEIRQESLVLQENFDFSKEQPIVGAQNYDYGFSNQAEADFYTKECIDFEAKYAEDQLTGKIQRIDIE